MKKDIVKKLLSAMYHSLIISGYVFLLFVLTFPVWNREIFMGFYSENGKMVFDSWALGFLFGLWIYGMWDYFKKLVKKEGDNS